MLTQIQHLLIINCTWYVCKIFQCTWKICTWRLLPTLIWPKFWITKNKTILNKEKKSKPSMSHFLRSSPLSKKIAYNCECSSPKCTSKNVKKSCDILVMEKSITYQFFFLRQLFSQMIGMFNFSVGGVKNHKGHTQSEYSFHERIFNFEDEPIFFKLIRSLIWPKHFSKKLFIFGQWV